MRLCGVSLLVLTLLTPVAVGCGGGGKSVGARTTVSASLPALKLKGDPARGKQVWASSSCNTCHTLKDAGASATEGPNLDKTKPSFARVVERVTLGKNPALDAPAGAVGMPAFSKPNNYMPRPLTDQQIADVAQYVSSVAGR
jgi:mono/diheme cytochrome c family protein